MSQNIEFFFLFNELVRCGLSPECRLIFTLSNGAVTRPCGIVFYFQSLVMGIKVMPRLTSRLSLRPPIHADLKRLFGIYGDPATHQFSPLGPLMYIEQAEVLLEKWIKHWEERSYGQWVISTRESPHHVIGFGGIDARDFLDVERVIALPLKPGDKGMPRSSERPHCTTAWSSCNCQKYLPW
jgi:hypothetical protein